MTSKRVLFITDDWHGDDLEERRKKIEKGQSFRNKHLRFKVKCISGFDEYEEGMNDYDAVLIDYGIMDCSHPKHRSDHLRADDIVEIVQTLHGMTVGRVAWVSAMPYEAQRDVRKSFSEATFMHGLLASNISIDEIIDVLYRLFDPKQKPIAEPEDESDWEM